VVIESLGTNHATLFHNSLVANGVLLVSGSVSQMAVVQ